MHKHTEACVWTVKTNGKRRCKTARQEYERSRRAQGLRAPAETRARDYLQPPDGLEDEYGPVPLRVPNTQWYDEVIVLRLLNGQPTGRRPYILELDAFFRRNKTTTFQQVLNATGLQPESLRARAFSHGYKFPKHLTDVGKMGKDFS